MSIHPNWFTIIGVEKNATILEIEQAYQKLLIQHEIDRTDEMLTSEERVTIVEEFALITQVYGFLIKRISGSKARIQRIKPLERRQPLIFQEIDRSIAKIEASLPQERCQWDRKFRPLRESIELMLDDF